MRVCFLMLVCATAIMETGARAADLNAVFTRQQNPDLFGNPRADDAISLWAQFQNAFDHRATGVFQDQFQPYNFSNVNALWAGQDFSRIRDYQATVARHAFTGSFRSSARDVLLDLNLPIVTWLRERRGFLAKLFWNSLDTVDEESVSPLDPSYRSVERSWWRKQAEEGHLLYGVRPFRTDPYVYAGWRIRDAAERVLLLGDVRYYFKNLGDHCFQLTLSTPITRDISLQLGTSYQFGKDPSETKMVLQLLKTFRFGGILNVGL